MLLELAQAHKAIDNAVKNAYGGKSFGSDAERVADLMERYQALAETFPDVELRKNRGDKIWS